MHTKLFRAVLIVGGIVLLLILLYTLAAQKEMPQTIEYGASFNTIYARELGLEPRAVYRALLDELGVRQLRLAAHWPLVEPEDDNFYFEEFDYQLSEAEKRGASVIMAVGRRLPRWPECHIPEWAEDLSWQKQQEEILEYITEVINRYKDHEAITHWQIENEPFLTVFAREHCGDLDVSFLDREIELVRSLDPSRPILLTGSGNLGTWYGAYRRADVFGTSVYVYLWNPDVGAFRTILPPSFYRVKENVMELFFGDKPTILIELSAEPWLLYPIAETPLSIQLDRMNIEKFQDIVHYAEQTRLSPQYLWGVEWWYWLRKMGDERMWEYAKTLFQ